MGVGVGGGTNERHPTNNVFPFFLCFLFFSLFSWLCCSLLSRIRIQKIMRAGPARCAVPEKCTPRREGGGWWLGWCWGGGGGQEGWRRLCSQSIENAHVSGQRRTMHLMKKEERRLPWEDSRCLAQRKSTTPTSSLGPFSSVRCSKPETWLRKLNTYLGGTFHVSPIPLNPVHNLMILSRKLGPGDKGPPQQYNHTWR